MITGNEVFGVMQSYSNNIWPGIQHWIFPAIFAFSAFFVILLLGAWIYTSLAYSEIAKKLKYKKFWLAWIPFARSAMILQIGGFDWPLIFLLIIPILGWIAVAVLLLISMWRIFEKRKYSGSLVLIRVLGVIPYLLVLAEIAYYVTLGFVAWQDKKGRR